MNRELIQLINIIRYRLKKSLQKSDIDFFDFKAGNDARSPSEILGHLVDVSNYGLHLAGAEKPKTGQASILDVIDGNFMALKSHLTKNEANTETSIQLINGPLSDSLTHIGQLTLLRRLSGDPIAWENYTKADT